VPRSLTPAHLDSPVGGLNLHAWSSEGPAGLGAWQIAAGGDAAQSLAPDASAFLVSAMEYSQVTLSGSLHVLGEPQVGSAGLVLGYRAPLQSAGTTAHEYVLLAWNPPTGAPQGIRGEWVLSRVRPGALGPVILAQVGGSPDGYGLEAPRIVTIEYSPERIRVVAAEEEIVDVQGIFPSGRIGFYAAGGARARFSRFTAAQSAPALNSSRLIDGEDPEGDPIVGATATKSYFWPADHQMRGIQLKVYAFDPSGTIPTVGLQVYSDEPDDQNPADGNQWPDADFDTDPLNLILRRERASAGDGRVYLIRAEAVGSAGTAHDCLSVVVPLTDGTADLDAALAQGVAATAFCDANGAAPAGFELIAQGPYVVAPPDQRIKPIVDCVVPGTPRTAVFGYQNDNPVPVDIPVGADNQFAPLPSDRGQATHFKPGRSPLNEGSLAFSFAGSSQTWSIRGPDGSLRTATASSNSIPCTFTPATPVAVDDQATTAVDTPIDVPVLANDSDPQVQILSVSRVSAASYGAVSINPDGTVRYAPQSGFAGTDSFEYVITDGAYGWDKASVSLTVSGQGNQPPVVDAGVDQAITLPATASLQGTATDDGLPVGGALTVGWSKDSGPGTVTFTPLTEATSTASFSTSGTYLLRLTASDSQLSASDTVTVIVSAPAGPALSIGDATVTEGHDGSTDAVTTVTLSSPSASPVTVRYKTSDQTASAACDYLPQAGDLTFAPGETAATVTVPVVGELLAETNETFAIELGEASGAAVADASGVVTITNDDEATSPPNEPADRTPANGTIGTTSDPTLTWTATDPDGDALTYDVYFGAALDPTGQEWLRQCPAMAGPSARFGSASAYDDTSDRLMVFGGQAAGGDVAEVWVLENATGLGGPPRWTHLTPSGGPSARQRAAAAYDPSSNRLIVVGGCENGCTTARADAWVLTNANGSGGAPLWIALPDAPGSRFGHAGAYDPAQRRLMVFGGSSGSSLHADLWILSDATGMGTPAWATLGVAPGPSAREGASAAYDPLSNRLLVFGGREATGSVSGETWELSNANGVGAASAWSLMATSGAPPAPRWGHASFYDAAVRRLVVFGGTGAGIETGTNIPANDVAVLASDGSWVHLEPATPPAPARFLCASAYSPGRARLVVVGGRNNRVTPSVLDDLWTLSDPIGRLPLASDNQATQSFVAPIADAGATYYWRVVDRDQHGAANGSPVWSFSPNQPPTVDAGPDQTILVTAQADLVATVADDGLPSSLVIDWTVVSGAGAAVFSSMTYPETSVRFSEPGTYVLRITAEDGAASASDELTVTVQPEPGVGRTWTTTADFEEGVGSDMGTANDELRLADPEEPFSFLWVAVSTKGTIVKIDTVTGAILGEYWTSPDGEARDPSRTTVDRDGKVWASNRAGNSVVHIGLRENGQCVDRNGNGTIETSTGQNNTLAWPNTGGADTNGGVSTALDECILHYTRVTAGGTRHLSVNGDNDVWVSGYGSFNAGAFDLIDGVTGQIKRSESSVGFGGYGGLIDANEVVWSARPFLRWDTRLPLAGPNGGNWTGTSTFDSYGMCIDREGNVWNTSVSGDAIRKFAPDGTLVDVFQHGNTNAQGCAVDARGDVWVAHSLYGSTVGHIKNDGTYVGQVELGLGTGPTGVAVDAAGKVWATNYNSRTVSRIDPAAGPIGEDGVTRVGAMDFNSVDLGGNPYNYSDMTGTMLLGAPASGSGTWTASFDSGNASAAWGLIRWNASACGDGSIEVEVSSSADATPGAWHAVANGHPMPVPAGRFLHVRVTLRRAEMGESPVLHDLSVGTMGFDVPGGGVLNQAPSVNAGHDQPVETPEAQLEGQACDDARPETPVAIAWSQVGGPGEAVITSPHQTDTVVHFRAQDSADLSIDFSEASNPSGAWTYGWMAAPGGTFVPGVNASYFGRPSWQRSTGPTAQYPLVSGNPTPVALVFSGSIIPPGFTHLHPSGTGERAVVRWTAPAAGTYVFEGRFQGLSTLNPTTDVAIHAPATSLFAGTISNYAQQVPFSLTRTVTAGATIDFSVGYGSNLNETNDSTGLLVSVRREDAPSPHGPYVLRLSASDSELDASDDVVVTVQPPTCQPIPAGTLGLWPGDGNAMNLVNDEPATLEGSLAFGPGTVAHAFLFDGVNDQAVVENPPQLTEGSFTLATWVRTADLSERPLLDFSSPTVYGSHLWQGVGANGPALGALYGSVIDSAGLGHVIATKAHALIPGLWQHVALTYERSSGLASLYVDGQRVAAAAIGSFMPIGNLPFGIGYRVHTGQRFKGALDEALLIDRALSEAEVRDAYLAGALGYCKPEPPLPDLAVNDVDLAGFQVDGQTLQASGSLSAEIANLGMVDAREPFEVTFFEDRNGNATLETGTDAVLAVANVPELAPGPSVVSALASGQVLFAGSAVHVFVDSGDAVEEGTETNNYGSSLDCSPACLPDLSPSFVRRVNGPTNVTLTVRIGNGGGSSAPADVSVKFYDGQPGAGGTLLPPPTATAAPVAAGAFEDVAIAVPSTTEAMPLWVVVDGPDDVDESNEANNAYNSRLFLTDVPNAAPVASAGPDQRLAYPQSATSLDGTVTDDGRPLNEVHTTWGVVSGPGTVVFGNASAVDTSATFGVPGTYVLRLTADDQELTASDEVSVVVEPPNQAPVVNAGLDQSVSITSAALDATITDDGLPFDATVSVTWSQVSGPAGAVFSNANSVNTTVTLPDVGTYVFRLAANDTALTGSDDVQVVALPFVNQSPVVSAGADQSLTLPQNALTLAGTATDDGLPPPGALTYAWTLLSGPGPLSFGTPGALQTTATFANPGTYVIRFGASDGATNSFDDAVVTVQPASPTGPAPSAALTSPAAGTRITGPVNVVGSALSDSLASWQLERRLKGDGPWVRFASGTTQVTNGVLGSLDATLLLNGITELRLTVTDTAGRFASATTDVVVKEQQKVGNFTVSFVDLEVPVAGLPIRVTRSYDSRDKRQGDFGFGWRLELSDVRVEETDAAGLAWQGTVSPGFFATYCLTSQKPPVVTLTLPDGRVLDFQMTLTPACQPFAPIDFAHVSYAPVGTTLGTLVPASGADVYVFASWPGPAELYDAADFSLFDPSLYRYTSPDGRVFLVHDTQGLKSVTDLSGNSLTVSPNGITHSSGKGITFTRDDSGRIAAITDPSGETLLYGYDGNGDLESHTDRESNTTRLGYHLEFPHHLVSIEDPLGRRPIRNEYDDDGRLVRHLDAFGKTIEYAHQLGVRREIVTDRNLKQRVLDYDERGNVLQETDPLGKVVLRTYDARNNRLTETLPHDPGTPNPPTTTYTYDGADNVLSVTDPENNRSEYTYNARKQVLTVKDPRGHFTTNVYDAKGNLTSTRVSATLGGPALSQSTHTFDSKGNLRTQLTGIGEDEQLTSYGYDAFGNLTQESQPSGQVTTHAYDANGRRLRQTTGRSVPEVGFETLETRYEYDANGRLLRTIDPDGSSSRSVYDPLGRQVESYDKLEHKTTSEYDEMGRLTRTTYADTTFEESTYDDEGRRLSFRDRRGKVTTYEYDDTGRLKKTTFPDTNFTENTYDAAGRLTAVRDARGKTTTYEYDKAGRRTKVTAPITTGVSAETVFTYDANGNQLTVRDPLLRTTTFEYDVLNRRTKTIFHDTTYTETTYDGMGRRKTERDQAGRITSFGYDLAGRLNVVTDAREKLTRYDYDEVGNRVTQRDAMGRETHFEYDRLGRETKRTLPFLEEPVFETKSYDAAGNLSSRTDFAGRVTAYTYDVMNRLVTRIAQCASPPCVGAADAAFTYTASGRRETASDARGLTEYAYDDRDRLQSLTYPDGRKLEYLYDANGNRTTLTATIPAVGGGSPTVLTTAYTYDDANRLDLVTDTADRVYDHGYDVNGNRTSLAQPNGTQTTYAYNTLNRLTSLTTTHGGDVVQGYTLTLGPAGNRERIDEADGTARIYTYDELYRLTGDTVTIGALNAYTKTFVYDDVGNRQTQTTAIGPAGPPSGPLHPAGMISYEYDERDRLTRTTFPGTGPTDYGWDVDGNLITKSGEGAYTWDRENRLVRVDKTDGTVVEHTYDADGVRVRTVTTPSGGSAATTNFLVDTSGWLSHVVAETNAAGVLQVHYVRGDDLLSLMRPPAGSPTPPIDWLVRYYHADHIGSVRRLTNEAGQITDGYTYSAFGELLAHTGSDPQPYAFTGEPYDPNVGFQYHRARWMDPRVGRFVGMDPFGGRTSDPLSLHRYLYAGVDPTSRMDPSGREFTAIGSLSATYVITTLATAQASLGFAIIDLLYYGKEAFQEGNFGSIVVDESQEGLGLANLGWAALLTTVLISVVLSSGRRTSKPLRWSQISASARFSTHPQALEVTRGKTIGHVARLLRTGAIQPDAIPVRYVVRPNGTPLIVDTRSSLALTRARIPQGQWRLINASPDVELQQHITNRLNENGLSDEGTEVLRIGPRNADLSFSSLE
jgi:RHS repeat-associated protein